MEEVVETFGVVAQEYIVLKGIVKLSRGVLVSVSVGTTVLMPLTLRVGCVLVVVPVVILSRASATAAVPQYMVVIPLLFFVAQHVVRFRNGTELIGGGRIVSVLIGVVFEDLIR